MISRDFHSLGFKGSDVPNTSGRTKSGSLILKLFRPFERSFVKINHINSIKNKKRTPTRVF